MGLCIQTIWQSFVWDVIIFFFWYLQCPCHSTLCHCFHSTWIQSLQQSWLMVSPVNIRTSIVELWFGKYQILCLHEYDQHIQCVYQCAKIPCIWQGSASSGYPLHVASLYYLGWAWWYVQRHVICQVDLNVSVAYQSWLHSNGINPIECCH
jgi:hypothetical protein